MEEIATDNKKIYSIINLNKKDDKDGFNIELLFSN